MSLPTRKIGTTDVSAIGYGTMGLSAFYGAVPDDEERLKFLDKVYENGCTFWDTANIYGDSEVLLGKWFKRTGKRNEIFLATKFGYVLGKGGATANATPEAARKALDTSLERLGVDSIDLWYLHKPDSNVPIEITVGVMAEAVKAGKVKYLGLSNCSAETIRRAHAVHPIAAVQMEYAPFTLDIENPSIGIFETAKELGITIIAYSPLGRGILSGKITSPDDLEAGDMRHMLPRYSKENLPKCLEIVESMRKIADRHGATPGQIALAWLLAQGSNIIPIPGTKKEKYLKENLGAANIHLSNEEVEEIRAATKSAGVDQIPRVPAAYQATMFGDTPSLSS